MEPLQHYPPATPEEIWAILRETAQLTKKAETFKALFPLYKDYTLYLGLAGFHVFANAEKEATKQGVGIIKQVGKNMVINDAHLKKF